MNMFEYKTLYKTSVGLDRFFDHVDQLLNDVGQTQSFPPYNLFKDNDVYTLELAVAGFSREDLSISLTSEAGMQQLIINGNKDRQKDEERDYITRGLATRKFTRTFTLAENVRVDQVKLVDGVLTIKLLSTEPKASTKLLTIE